MKCSLASWRLAVLVGLISSAVGAANGPELRHDGSTDVIVDDAEADRVELTAYWERLSADRAHGAHGETVLSDGGYGADAIARFRPELPRSGVYAVYLYWPSLASQRPLATNAGATVYYSGGARSFLVNQQARPEQWNLLGTFHFDIGDDVYAEIRNDAADGIVLADAVLFRSLSDSELADPPLPDTSVVRPL